MAIAAIISEVLLDARASLGAIDQLVWVGGEIRPARRQLAHRAGEAGDASGQLQMKALPVVIPDMVLQLFSFQVVRIQ
jgi:hypothetical protein